jgi:membrane protein required for colicin V production
MCPFKHIAAQVQERGHVARFAFISYARERGEEGRMNGMNGFDYVAIALIAVGAIYGLQRGALRMLTTVVALGAAIYCASFYYNRAGALAETQLGSSHTVGAVIGFVAIFALIFAAVEIIGSFAIRLTQVVHLSPLDRLAGGLLGAGVAAVFAGIAVMLMAAVMPPDAALLHNSQLVPMLLAYNETLVGYIPGDAKLAYERNRDDLMRYWVQNAVRVANSAPSPAASPSPSAK